MQELLCNTNTKALMGFSLRTNRPAGPETITVCSTVHNVKALSSAKFISAANMRCRGHSSPPVADHHLFILALSYQTASLCVCTL